jgi:hypothetical protein
MSKTERNTLQILDQKADIYKAFDPAPFSANGFTRLSLIAVGICVSQTTPSHIRQQR